MPARLAPIDLMAASAIALVALSLIAGPALSQGAGTPPPTDASIHTAVPELSPPGASPSLPPGASPSLPPGAHSLADPCAPTPSPDPGSTPHPDATKPPPPNLCPAQPHGADPLALLSWAFTPIFQVIFLGLAFLYSITGDIGTAIILLTIIIRILLIPVFRAQIVSQRRMQMLQPELRAIQLKYKGDRARISAEQMQLYRDRGVNPASGCLPALIQLVLLLPMYQVFSQGLTAPDISSMLTPLGIPVVDIQCQDPGDPYAPCIDPDIPWLAWIPTITDEGFQMPGYPGGLPANLPEIFVMVFAGLGLGLSLLALVSALLQLVQTRMMMTRTDDPQQRAQQRIFLLLPAFSLIYGAILPAGLFIYWITTTVFSIVQQFLINGYGGLFPIRGWTPRFAVDHQPRFPVTMPEPKPRPSEAGGTTTRTTMRSTSESAAGTIRPARRRSSRRGRRR
jgi:YidC/Oxa1 family membrane protein insertase